MRKSKTREKQPEKYAHTSFEGCLHIFFPHFSYTFFLDTTTATHRQLPHFTFTFLRRIKLRGVAKGINFTSKIFRQKKKEKWWHWRSDHPQFRTPDFHLPTLGKSVVCVCTKFCVCFLLILATHAKFEMFHTNPLTFAKI